MPSYIVMPDGAKYEGSFAPNKINLRGEEFIELKMRQGSNPNIYIYVSEQDWEALLSMLNRLPK